MVLTINISVMPTVEGAYYAQFSFHEWNSSSVTHIPYFLKTTFNTKDEAIQHAKASAIREAREKYGEDTQVSLNIHE